MNEQPDYQLDNADLPAADGEPKIYAVSNLKSFVKPDLDEELTTPPSTGGGPAICGTEVVCSCVPVETCTCNVVSYRVGGTPDGGGCSCVDHCTTCVGLYWYPS